MAVLGKIRNKMGILISVVVGLALLSFILSDMLSPGKSIFSGSQNEVANIAGKSINIQDFQQEIDKTIEIYKFNSGQSNIDEQAIEGIREQTWQQVLEENIYGNEYDELGVSVSLKELSDMVQGANPHPIVKQLFTNPETGELNRAAISQFLKNLDEDKTGQRKMFWIYIENSILRERLKTKYFNLVRKGLYTTTEQVNTDLKESSEKANISFVSEKFSSISDSAISVSKTELEDYIKKHSADFKQEPSRDIEYVTFDIAPSQDDYIAAQGWINKLKDEFKAATEIKNFVSINSDTQFDEKYYKQSELPDSIKGLFNAKVGESVGPYFENNSFKIARLAAVENVPDSVEARHILIRPEAQTKEAVDKAKALADSIKSVIKKGASFEALALQYSADGSKSKGGDLGWFKEGAMVKPFNDACFNGKKGELTIVETQFGIHVIEVTDKGKDVKKVQIGILERKVEPSSATYQAIYQKASAFAGLNNTAEKFDAAVKKENITPKVANYIQENTKQIPGMESSREMVRWAYKAKEGEISPVKEFGSVFVVAKLKVLREKGTSSLSQVKDQVELLVKKDKKAAQLVDKLNKDLAGVKSIDELAGKLNTTAQAAGDITFNSYAIPSVGFEPNVIAASFATKPNTLSKPVKGNNGVYVVFVNGISQMPVGDTNSSKSRIDGNYQNRVNYELFNTLKELADVQDSRSTYY
jgi:peptidyl-prolyl cis-trans isomerase D